MPRSLSALLVVMLALASLGSLCNPALRTERTVRRVDAPAHEKQRRLIGNGERFVIEFPDGADPHDVIDVYLKKAYELGGDYVSGVQLQLHVGGSICFAELIPAQEKKLVRSRFIVREKTTRCTTDWLSSSSRSSSSGGWHRPGGSHVEGYSLPKLPGQEGYVSPSYGDDRRSGEDGATCRTSSSSHAKTRREMVLLKKLVPLPVGGEERDRLAQVLQRSSLLCAPIDGVSRPDMHVVAGAIYPRSGTRIVPGPRRLRVVEQVCGERARWVAVEAPEETLEEAGLPTEIALGTSAAYVEADEVLRAWTGRRVTVTLKTGETVTGALRRWQNMVLVLRLDDPEAPGRYVDFDAAERAAVVVTAQEAQRAAPELPQCPGAGPVLDVTEIANIGERLTPEQQALLDGWVGRRVRLHQGPGVQIVGALSSARRGRFVLDVGGGLISIDVGDITSAELLDAPEPAP